MAALSLCVLCCASSSHRAQLSSSQQQGGLPTAADCCVWSSAALWGYLPTMTHLDLPPQVFISVGKYPTFMQLLTAERNAEWNTFSHALLLLREAARPIPPPAYSRLILYKRSFGRSKVRQTL